MKILLILQFTMAIAILTHAQLPTDTDGWTIIEPSYDSKIVYVSSSEGDDNNDGLTKSTPVATIAKAKSLIRQGYPDHVLFKRGDVWEGEAFGYFFSGRSKTEPIVLSYYGDSGERPLFKLLTPFIINTADKLENLAIIGLEFYGFTRDPNSPDFNTSNRLIAIDFEGSPKGGDILLEDCVARFVQIATFSNNDYAQTHMYNIKLRRCIAFGAYAENSCCEHVLATRAQGFYAASVDGIVIEDCLFDQNGWNPDVESATRNMYNHNIYLQDRNKGYIRLSNNIIARGASHGVQARSGAIMEHNLFVQNACAGFISGNPDNPGYQADSMRVKWNVALEGVRMNNEIAQSNMVSSAVEALRARNKFDGIDMSITDNIAAHRIDNGSNNGISNTGSDGVIRSDNINYKWDPGLDNDGTAYLDPEVTLASYHLSLGKTGTTEAFLKEARKRPLKTWWPEYTAKAVNEYIRFGFSSQKDTIPPLAPQELIPEYILGNSFSLRWPIPSDNIRTAGYNIMLNGLPVAENWTSNKFVFSDLKPDTKYNVHIISYDSSGNASKDTASVSITTKPADDEEPSKPEGLEVVESGGDFIRLSWLHSSDNYDVVSYTIYLEGTVVNAEYVKDSIFTIQNLEELTEYSVEVEAVDGAGNTAISDKLIVKTSDITRPSRPLNVNYSYDYNDNIIIMWDLASDNGEIAGYNIYIQNVKMNDTIIVAPPYSLSSNLFVQGNRISISAVDTYGNESFKSSSIEIITSIENLRISQNVKVYPNPATTELILESHDRIKKVQIFNFNGQLMLEQILLNSYREIIPVNSYKPGHYLLKIDFGFGKKETWKFIKH